MDYLKDKDSHSNMYIFLHSIKNGIEYWLARLGITREKYSSCIAMLICPILNFYLFDLYTSNPFKHMHFRIQLLNIAFFLLLELLLFGIFKYARIAMILETISCMVVGLANFYVQSFRSIPILPWDIYSISTAKSVAGNYDYSLEWSTALILAAFVVLIIIESRFHMKAPSRTKKRLALVLLSIVFLHSYINLVQSEEFHLNFGMYDKLFTPTVISMRNGNIVAFLMEMKYVSVDKPEGYSADDIKEFYNNLLSENGDYVAAVDNPESINRPNIIVIMDEAFSDLAVLGDFETNEDYMPFVHSLQQGAENTVTGTLNVSVLGGNTANSEFEFLTGNTMAFLPNGSVAYQQYLKNATPSLASYLKDLNYKTVAIHPYNASGWERNRVYPLIGFDKFYSLKNFSKPDKIRDYVSDEESFKKIISIYEKKADDEPLFVFNVTMQNHGGYEEKFTNFTPDISVKDIDTKSLPMYLSLIKQSDSAFRELTEYFAGKDEDTIIVLFGDHQPTTYVSNPILRSNGINPADLSDEENLNRYKVPFVIWANYDIDEKSGGETSTDFLMIDLLQSAGLPLPAYQSYLAKIRSDYPVISAVQVTDSEGNISTAEAFEEELNTYRSLEYYLLFDYNN